MSDVQHSSKMATLFASHMQSMSGHIYSTPEDLHHNLARRTDNPPLKEILLCVSLHTAAVGHLATVGLTEKLAFFAIIDLNENETKQFNSAAKNI